MARRRTRRTLQSRGARRHARAFVGIHRSVRGNRLVPQGSHRSGARRYAGARLRRTARALRTGPCVPHCPRRGEPAQGRRALRTRAALRRGTDLISRGDQTSTFSEALMTKDNSATPSIPAKKLKVTGNELPPAHTPHHDDWLLDEALADAFT